MLLRYNDEEIIHQRKDQFFRRYELPSVNLAFPPVGWHSTLAQAPHSTTVCACEKTVVMAKQPGHLTSMKYELGDCTRRLSLWERFSVSAVGLRRSTARVILFAMRMGKDGCARCRR